MNCSDIAETLDNRIVAQLNAAERRDIQVHIASCAGCARDWELHAAFGALSDMCEPGGFTAECRAMVASAANANRSQRVRRRLVLIGGFAAFAAAAAMLATTWRAPESKPVAAEQEPVSLIPAGGDAISVAAEVEKPEPALTSAAQVEAAIPVPAPEKFTVLVQPLVNEGADAISRASINAMYAAVLRELEAIPGARLIDANAMGAGDLTANYQITVRGGAGTGAGSFSAHVTGQKRGPDGRMQGAAATSTIAAPPCPAPATSKPGDCHSPASLASRAIEHIRATLFPFDLAAQHLLQAKLLDTQRGLDERLGALSVLAGRSATAGTTNEVFSDPAVVRSAIELATSHADESRRAHVWRTLRSVHHPALLQPLIAAAMQGAEREVQQEAVVTLAGFAEDPRARDALQTLARADSRPLVRALAQRGLSGEAYWNQYVAASLKDTTRTDAERIEAFLYHAVGKGPSVESAKTASPQALRDVLDDDAIKSLALLLPRASAGKRPENNRIGLVLVNVASAIDHPAISEMLLENLMTGTDGNLWMSVAAAVVSFRGNDPALRATLQKIATEDPDPTQREAAERILQQPERSGRVLPGKD